MREDTISEFLDRLADRVPAPGGGASAALHAAQAGALLAMVARYSTGEKYAAHQPVVERIIRESDTLRGRALTLAEQDAAAFTAVTDAYRLPKDDEAAKAARSAAIARALADAARPPAEVITVALDAVELAETLLPIGNPNVVTDIAAAAEAARAAATTARVNVEVNLSGIRDERTREALLADTARVDEIAARAERVTAAVRAELAK
ncbi:cyclodeaminase/cyclohydrolase family protein [Kitasatospora sp. NBC_01287]|uniref:cyclodeaminase/cyclohydrolase family protein n=1 Tax=Kitasatospora sp. NBC_01287 TaxID=2903573 RepID=UPI00224EDADD|nr:cyclodeaminase/cyclohydrolase family protein [Kitasatospora sp. NBC_01287]MCX4747624.1 cyclodeaminase/cyclohydrolase family protein [Kitasatospora sp. NBC_01287]